MNYGKALYEILRTDAQLVALLGGEKIYPIHVPQEENYPYVSYSKLQQTPNETKTSTSIIDVLRIQVDVFAEDYGTMEVIDERVRFLLDYFRGLVNTVAIDCIHMINSVEIPEAEVIFHTATDYQIRINRDGTIGNLGTGTPLQENDSIKQIWTNISAANVSVTAAAIPADTINKLEVFRSGQLMIEGEDYTVAGQQINFILPLFEDNLVIKILG